MVTDVTEKHTHKKQKVKKKLVSVVEVTNTVTF